MIPRSNRKNERSTLSIISLIIFTSILFFLVFNSKVSGQWTEVFNDPSYFLSDVKFQNETTGFACGGKQDSINSFGVVLRTVDGGLSWSEVYLSPPNYPNSWTICLVNDTVIIIGGQDGGVLKTTDGGETWDDQPYIPGLWDIHSLKFFDENVGMAHWGRTTDGGYTWTDMGIGWMKDHSFYNDSTGIITTGEGIFYTSDYGVSWTMVEPDIEGAYFTSVSMVDEIFGIAGTDKGQLFRTTNGGLNWELFDSLIFDSNYLRRIRMCSAQAGYILEGYDDPRVLRTYNGGSTWDYVYFGSYRSNDFDVQDENTIWLPTYSGTILKTTNGGGEIVPSYTDVSWYSSLAKSEAGFVQLNATTIDSSSNLYVAGRFLDSVYVKDAAPVVSKFPDRYSLYVLRYPPNGEVPFSFIVEDVEKDLYMQDFAIDKYNNVFILLSCSNYDTMELRKMSAEGNLIWTINLSSTANIGPGKLQTDDSGSLFLAMPFIESISFGDSTLLSDRGIALIEIASGGSLTEFLLLAEFTILASNYFDFIKSQDGSIGIACYGPGPAIVYGDTVGISLYHILYFDNNNNFQWHNNYFNINYNSQIFDIEFINDNELVAIGMNYESDTLRSGIYTFNSEGVIENMYFFHEGGGPETFCEKGQGQLLLAGNYWNKVSFMQDTLYGFNSRNAFIYHVDEEMNVIESSHIGRPGDIFSLHEHMNNSYAIGNFWTGDIIIKDDTIVMDNNRIFILKLNETNSSFSNYYAETTSLTYPNPTNGEFNVIIPGNDHGICMATVYSLSGQKIAEFNISNNNSRVSLAGYQKGVYIIQVTAGKNTFVSKVIIQ